MFFQPRDIEEALRIRAEMGDDVRPLGGGTDIIVALNRSTTGPKHYLDLTHLDGYSDISRDNGEYQLSAGTSFTQLGKLPIRAVAEASMTVGGVAIRNRGTIAGNLGTASPAGDGCVALLAVDAEVEVSHAKRGKRTIPIDDYFTGFRKTALLADELITGVRVPAGWRTAWYKIGKRGSINISLVCCAIGVSPRGEVRVAFGCAAPRVIRARAAERIIENELSGLPSVTGVRDDVFEAAAQAAMKDVAPIDDFRASAAYKRAMCGVLTRRLLRQLRDEE